MQRTMAKILETCMSWIMTVAVFCVLVSSQSYAQTQDTLHVNPEVATAIPDTVQAVNPDTITDENFVIASLLVASPGDVLYSKVGHCALRMQCPTHDLDYVFSYESEDVRHRVLAFLAGKLKMGMFAIPTQDYLNTYKEAGRSVTEYTLNIPIDAKRNLWRVLDEHVAEGANLPYDYITRGCAHSTLMMLKDGIAPLQLFFESYPPTFSSMTRRELTGLQMKDNPWTWCFLNMMVNGSIDDTDCSNEEKIIMPADLVESLASASIDGRPLITAEPRIHCSASQEEQPCLFTPLLLAFILLVISIVGALLKWKFWDYVLLAVQTLLGIFTLYLVAFSSLCCTEWSWLLVPFNPLPLIFWKWRRHWALPFAAIIGIWCIVMVVYPHQLTDVTFVVLSIALIVSYVNMFIKYRNK